MMMPANFSAVSENEMTYVMGGSIADYLAPAMGAAQGFLDNTVGAVFSGTWTPGDGLTGFGGQFSTIWKKNYTDNVTDESTGAQKFGYGALGVVNSILNVAGNLAAIYNLGFGAAKNIVGEGVYKA